MSLIVSDIKENIGVVCLNNPGKRNALSEALVDELLQTLQEFQDRKIPVVILRVAEGCSGLVRRARHP